MRKDGKRNYVIKCLTGLFCMSMLLTGCAGRGTFVDENLIGVPKDNGSERVTVKITTNMDLKHFAAAVEERFDDIRLIQDSYMGDFRVNEHLARVEHEDFGDLVMIKAGHVPKADLSGLLMDLSTQPFPANYSAGALQADEAGHIYLVPGPLSFNCNIYNKTLFEENGWAVPKTYDEFLEICGKIDESGIRGYRFVYHDSSLQSFQIYNYCVRSALDTLTQVEGQTWHNKLLAGEKVSLEPMETAFQDIQRLMDAGLVRIEDLDFTGSMRNDAFLGRQIAISPGEIDLLQKYNNESADEFCFLPHFSMTDGQGWLLNLGYYFGASQDLNQKGNEKKRSAAMEILSFIASEEGQQLLMEDGLGMVPATKGAKLPEQDYFEDIRTQFEKGRYIMRPGYDMFASVLGTEIAAFIRGETTSGEILEKCSRLLEEGETETQALGKASKDFTVLATGNLKADALRAASGADVALIGMSEANCYVPVGGTRSRLYEGKITDADITRIAQIKTDAPLLCKTVLVTGKTLLTFLEQGAMSAEEQEQGEASHFHPFAVSGLTLVYDLDAKEGSRVSNVKTADGKTLDPDAVYKAAFLDGVLTEKDGAGQEETGLTMTDALREYILTEQIVAPDFNRISFR